jgi:hypothetical protein
MAHFVNIVNGVVENVVVVADENCGGGVFPESEPIGQAFLASIGLTGTWLQTSYNANFRERFAGIGFTYDAENDVFVEQSVPVGLPAEEE